MVDIILFVLSLRCLTHQRLHGISIDRKISLTLQYNNLQHLFEYMTQDPTSLFNIKQSLKRRTFCRALHGHYSARYKCADFFGQKTGASSLDQHLAVPLLKQIEKSIPGTLRNTQDIFGNNALWYLLYHDGNSAGHPWHNERVASIESIEALLLKYGCDPDQPNCFDLTYSSIKTAQKELNHFV